MFGYIAPEPQKPKQTDEKGLQYETVFVYKKMSDDEIANTRRANIEITNANKEYTVGYDMTSNIVVNATGYTTQPIMNPTVRVFFDPEKYNVNNTTLNGWTKQPYIEGTDYLEFTRNTPINPSDSINIAFRTRFNYYVTPSNTEIPFHVELLTTNDQNEKVAVAKSNEAYFKGTYSTGALTISPSYSYDTVIDETENTAFVSDNGKNSITYQATHNPSRNIGDIETIAQLQPYEVDPRSQTYKIRGATTYPIFIPEENPGWSMDETSHTLVYAGDAKNDNITKTFLKLHYPGAKTNTDIPFTENQKSCPYNKPDTESCINVSASTQARFSYAPFRPEKPGIEKHSVGHIYGSTLYDNEYYRNSPFVWNISYNTDKEPFTNAVIEDTNLDNRLQYSSITIPQNLGNVTVSAYDDEKKNIYTQRITSSNQNERKVVFADAIKENMDGFTVTVENTIPTNTAGNIVVTTTLRNPSELIIPEGKESDTLSNTAIVSYNGATAQKPAIKTVYKSGNNIQATKTSVFKDASGQNRTSVITGDSVTFLVGFTMPRNVGKNIDNFTQIDLVPSGLTVNSYSMSSEFAKVPGARVEIVDNYRGTNRQAVIWSAPQIPYTSYKPGTSETRFNVGQIEAYVGAEFRQDRINNDTFVHATNMSHLNAVNNQNQLYSFLDAGEWSKAATSTEATISSELHSEKRIRTYNGETPNSWGHEVSTYPGQKFDYSLMIVNGTDNQQKGVMFYDVLPYIGDNELANNAVPRGTQVENVIDTSKTPTVPEGMHIEYYNSDTQVPEYNFDNAYEVLNSLQWSQQPSTNTKAIRVVPNDIDNYVIESGKTVEVIIPMIANQETNGQIGVPSENTANKTSYNTFYLKNDTLPYLIEGNRVSNTMKPRTIDIEFNKLGYTMNRAEGAKPLSGATFTYYREDGTPVSSSTSNEDGRVMFRNIVPKDGDKIVETKAPQFYKELDNPIVLTQETINEFYASDSTTAQLPDVINTMRYPIGIISPQQGKVVFKKVDADGKPLQNVVFRLSRSYNWTDSNGKTFTGVVNYEARSDVNGKVEFTNVEGIATNTCSSTGSNPNDCIKINSGNTNGYTLTEVNSVNNLTPIAPISGIKVKNKETTYVSRDGNGNIKISNTDNQSQLDSSLDENNAIIVNNKAAFYLRKLSIAGSNFYEDNNIDNPVARKFGTFGPSDGSMINGSTFDIYRDYNDGRSSEIVVSNIRPSSDGLTRTPELNVSGENDSYRLVEKVVPNNYQEARELDMRFKINARGQFTDLDGNIFQIQSGIYVPNLPKDSVGSVTITKVDKNNVNTKVPNAEFTLYKQNENGEYVVYVENGNITSKTTSSTGVVSWSNLPYGNYRAIETKAPNGYASEIKPYDFTVKRFSNNYSENNFKVNISNTPTQVRIHKVEYIARGFTSAAAAGLARTELGYDKNTADIVRNGESFDIVAHLSGARFELRERGNGEIVQDSNILITNNEGVANIDAKLNENTVYEVVETQAPEGYLRKESPITFKIDDYAKREGFDGNIDIYFPNNANKGRLVVSKVNSESGELITGSQARFNVQKLRLATPQEVESISNENESENGLIHYNGNSYVADSKVKPMNIRTGSNNALAVANNLDFGVYSIVETEAPDTYTVDLTVKVFEVNENNATYSYIFGNSSAKAEMSFIKTINGMKTSAINPVLLNSTKENDTISVSYSIENTGNTALRNVTISDIVENVTKEEQDSINSVLENASVSVVHTSEDGEVTTQDMTNGNVILLPGDTATLTIDMKAPNVNSLHHNIATVESVYGAENLPLSSTDEGYAYRLNTSMNIPHTGGDGLVILVVIGFISIILAMFFANRRNKKIA